MLGRWRQVVRPESWERRSDAGEPMVLGKIKEHAERHFAVVTTSPVVEMTLKEVVAVSDLLGPLV